jgi:pimeloyl-ACP methyl ester carboxylesterase
METTIEKTNPVVIARAEYIEVEPNVRLHVTDAGEGRPIVLAQCLIALRDTDLRADLAKIAIPTLIMHGKKDKICSFDLAEQMKSGISNSHIVAFENSGHSLFLEETQKFNAELIKFVTE